MTKPSNIKALETGSGITWDEWILYLNSIDAKELDHAQLAIKTLEKIIETGKSKSPEWWAQGVAVAYEQYVGKRQPGQTCTGDFSVTVSKTVMGDMDNALQQWLAAIDGVTTFNDLTISRPGAMSKTEKWRYWRCGMDDGSTVSVNIQTKPNGEKSSISINHDKLPLATDVDKWRTFWKAFSV